MKTFRAFRVEESENGHTGSIQQRSLADLPEGDVLIQVEYSSLNYKDALSISGNRGVTRQYPHTPGIDAAGTVVESSNPTFQAGDPVLVMGYDLGMNTDGGLSEYIRVPANWIVHRPDTLDAETAMVFGTAGFTAAMSVDTLLQVGIAPSQGSVLVTGATGGVGIIAVHLLKNLGFDVVALTGKMQHSDFLKALGAKAVLHRDAVLENAKRPMKAPQWAAAVDTVGGDILGNLIKSIQYGGSVACCGMVAGHELHTSVFPFILRGINLLGVDSVELPLDVKKDIWNTIGRQWQFPNLSELKQRAIQVIGLDGVAEAVNTMLSGQHVGRYVVKVHE